MSEIDNPQNADESGRNIRGQFTVGNSFSRGNVHNKRLALWRKAFYAVVSADQFKSVVQNLLDAALDGEPWAIREVLNRCLGTPAPVDVLQEIESMRIELERITDELAK